MVSRRDLLLVALVLIGMAVLGTTLFQSQADPRWIEQAESFATDTELQSVVQELNQEFVRYWQTHELQPAGRADDLLIARRLALSLTGTVPSLEEIRRLQELPTSNRINWWIDHLLNDRRSSDYLGERLARSLVGVENGPFLLFRRRRFVFWLSDQLAANRRYDAIARELIAETGLWTDTPAVNFYTATFDNNQDQLDFTRLAGRVSRAFLGMRIDCLQCHDDQLGNIMLGTAEEPRTGTQQDFHQLAAFFGQTEASLFGVREINDQGREYNYKYLHAEHETVVNPQVPFLPELKPDDGTRREQLARWLTDRRNRPFARAAVNRVWAILFGRPLVEPIDDIPLFEDPLNEREFPPTLERLADDFAAHDFDLRRLIRLIARLQVFQLSSQADFEIHPRHEKQWAVFPLTRLRPEQVAGSIIQSCSLQTIDAESNVFTQITRYFQEDDFIRRYGDMGQDEFEDRGGTVTQRLLMMNGRLVKERTGPDLLHNAATQIAAVGEDTSKAVTATYLAVLSRPPSVKEAAYFTDRLSGLVGIQRTQAFEDLYWILLNSTEFSWNH